MHNYQLFCGLFYLVFYLRNLKVYIWSWNDLVLLHKIVFWFVLQGINYFRRFLYFSRSFYCMNHLCYYKQLYRYITLIISGYDLSTISIIILSYQYNKLYATIELNMQALNTSEIELPETLPYLQPNQQKVKTKVVITIFGILIITILLLVLLLFQVQKSQQEPYKELAQYKQQEQCKITSLKILHESKISQMNEQHAQKIGKMEIQVQNLRKQILSKSQDFLKVQSLLEKQQLLHIQTKDNYEQILASYKKNGTQLQKRVKELNAVNQEKVKSISLVKQQMDDKLKKAEILQKQKIQTLQKQKKELEQYKKAEQFKPGVTMVLTSSNRYDLLTRTLESFNKHNTFPLQRVIIVEDGPYVPAIQELMNKYPTYTWLILGKQKKQVPAIDQAYSLVETEWVFHCEDDWEFTKPGFIQMSMEYLKKHTDVINIWIRHIAKFPADKDTFIADPREEWPGFTFNPSLKRMSDYILLKGGYSRLFENGDFRNGLSNQWDISNYYKKTLKFKAAQAPQSYIEHIGDYRHVG